MTDVPISDAKLIGLFFQSITYGALLVSFAFCLWALLWRDGCWRRCRVAEVHWQMVGVTVLFFTIATLDWGVEMLSIIKAFVMYQGPGGADEEFMTIDDWTKVTNVSSTTTVHDLVLLMRRY